MKACSFLILVLGSLYFAPGDTGPAVKCYRDINYWTLEGVHELSETEMDKYPYFKILESDSINRIIEMVTGSKSYKEHYVKKGNSWIMTNERAGDVSHVYQYTFVSEKKILIFDYLAVLSSKEGKGPSEKKLARMQSRLRNKRHYLASLSILDPTGRTDYTLSRKLKVWDKPNIDFDKNLKALPIESVIKRSYKIVDDVLIEERSKRQSDNQNVDVTCYALVDKWGYRHNLFWPMFFPESVQCN